MKYKIADFNVEVTDEKGNWYRKLDNYKADFPVADFTIDITEEDIEEQKNSIDIEYPSDGFYKFSACLKKLTENALSKNAFMLHSACFDVDGVGVAFSANSGTGKTTHMLLWQKLLGDKMVVVNGDKPMIRFFDDEPQTPYAYGTPWNGKEKFGKNMRTKLQHICFIERSKTNYVEEMKKEDAINLIFKQVYMPKNPVSMTLTMQLVDRLLSCCKLWKIHCNMELEAAEVAYNTIFNSK